MPGNIAIIQGTRTAGAATSAMPSPDAYAEGAEAAGHAVRRIEIATLDMRTSVARMERQRNPGAM